MDTISLSKEEEDRYSISQKEELMSEERPRMSSFARLANIVIDPAETSTDINLKPDWVLPVVLATIVSVGGNLIITSKLQLDPEKFMRQAMEEQIEKQGKSYATMSQQEKEQFDSQVKSAASVQRIGPYMSLVFIPASLALIALFFYIGTAVMDGQSTYPKVFSLTCYAFGIVGIAFPVLLSTIVVFIKNPEDIDLMRGIAATNPGMLLPKDASKPLMALLTRFDIFTIWYLILMVIGLERVSKNMSRAKSIGVVATLWFIWIVVTVLASSLF